MKLSLAISLGIDFCALLIRTQWNEKAFSPHQKKLQVVNSTGSILFETNIASGTTNIVLPMLAKGLYVVRIIGN
jgi:hypothetical protein